MKNQTPKLKPQLMYAVPDEAGDYGYHALRHTRDSRGRGHPVVCIPCDDPEAMADKAYRAFLKAAGPSMYDAVRAALTAIGVLPRARKGRK